MDHSQATSPATGEQLTAGEEPAAGAPGLGERTASTPGFGARGRMRRRARFLRKARELAYRDLGGLVYSLHRFGQRNDALVLAKLETIGRIDNELRSLETALAEHQPVTVLREAGVAACPRCAAIHGSEDRFCPNCGLAMDPRAERPVASAAAPAMAQPPTAPAQPAEPPSAALLPKTTPPTVAPAPTPRATPAPATARGARTAKVASDAGARAGGSVDESTEIIRPPIESS